MNLPNPEYDRPGFCCLCHCPIAEFDGERISRILSIIRPLYIRLNDGSMMQVTLCASCKDSMTEEDIPKIMDSVYKGWTVECDKMVVAGSWTKEKRDSHLDIYGLKYIIECDEKGMSQEKLEQTLGADAMQGEKIKNAIREFQARQIQTDEVKDSDVNNS